MAKRREISFSLYLNNYTQGGTLISGQGDLHFGVVCVNLCVRE